MANFVSIIDEVLRGLSPQSFCEIGVEGQLMTGRIISWASKKGRPIYGIDPSIDFTPAYQNYRLIRKPSHEGLHDVPECDVYFVDGDHNYYTVRGELERINNIPSSDVQFPLVFLHDVGWPGDRRDAYYLPSHVPSEFRREWTQGLGATPTQDDLSAFGIAAESPNYVFSNARGGPQNGVLTAVEDFVSDNPGWDFVAIPGIFGLGILYKRDADPKLSAKIQEIKTAVGWLGEEIAILEYNRLQLLCNSYESHHHFSLTINELAERKSRVSDLEREVREALGDRDISAQRVADLHVEKSALEQQVSILRDKIDELEQKVNDGLVENAQISNNLRAVEIQVESLERERLAAEQALMSANADCAAITGSWSYRIGRFLTAPIRWLRSFIKPSLGMPCI